MKSIPYAMFFFAAMTISCSHLKNQSLESPTVDRQVSSEVTSTSPFKKILSLPGQLFKRKSVSFKRSLVPSCEAHSGKKFKTSSLMTEKNTGEYFDRIRKAAIDILRANRKVISKQIHCVEKECQDDILKNSKERLVELRKMALFSALEKELMANAGSFSDLTFLVHKLIELKDHGIRYPGTNNSIGEISENEKKIFLAEVEDLRSSRVQKFLKDQAEADPICVSKESSKKYIVKGSSSCKSLYQSSLRRITQAPLRSRGVQDDRKARVMLISQPWLSKQNTDTIGLANIRNGLKEQKQFIDNKIKSLQQNGTGNKELKQLLVASPDISEAIIAKISDHENQAQACVVFHSLYSKYRDLEIAQGVGLTLATLVSVPFCLASQGALCYGSLALATGADATLWASSANRLRRAHKDYYSGLISESEFNQLEKENEKRSRLAVVGAVGPIFSAGKKIAGVVSRSGKPIHNYDELAQANRISRVGSRRVRTQDFRRRRQADSSGSRGTQLERDAYNFVNTYFPKDHPLKKQRLMQEYRAHGGVLPRGPLRDQFAQGLKSSDINRDFFDSFQGRALGFKLFTSDDGVKLYSNTITGQRVSIENADAPGQFVINRRQIDEILRSIKSGRETISIFLSRPEPGQF